MTFNAMTSCAIHLCNLNLTHLACHSPRFPWNLVTCPNGHNLLFIFTCSWWFFGLNLLPWAGNDCGVGPPKSPSLSVNPVSGDENSKAHQFFNESDSSAQTDRLFQAGRWPKSGHHKWERQVTWGRRNIDTPAWPWPFYFDILWHIHTIPNTGLQYMIQYAAKRSASLDYWIPMMIETCSSVPHSDAFEIADLDRTNFQNSQPALVLTSHALQPLMRSLGPREEVCTEFAKELRRRTPNEPAQWTWWFSVSRPWTVNKLALISIHLLSDVAEHVDMLGQSSPRANFPITSWLKYETFLNSKCKQFAFPKTYHLCISSCSLTSYFRWDVTIASSCRLPIRSRFKVRPGHQFVNCFLRLLIFFVLSCASSYLFKVISDIFEIWTTLEPKRARISLVA